MQSIISASIFTNFINLWQMLYSYQGHLIVKLGYCFQILRVIRMHWINYLVHVPRVLTVHWSNEIKWKKTKCKMKQSLFPVCLGHVAGLTIQVWGNLCHFSDSHCWILHLLLFPVPHKWFFSSKAQFLGVGLYIFIQDAC